MATIGKTRQRPDVEESFDAAAGKPRGVLKRPAPAGKFRHRRRSPAPDLVHAIDHYWMVSWDLRGEEPHIAETLPHPNFHLVFEKNHSTVNGVFTGKFSRRLEGEGQVFGIKFNTGGFRPLLHGPAAAMANRSVAAESFFDKDEVNALETVLVSRVKDDEKVEAAIDAVIEVTEAFLRRHVQGPDPAVVSATQLVRRILDDRDIRTVDDLSRRTGIGKRSLQRIFSEYVGASPKWVIRRYRLHELVEQMNMERMNKGAALDFASLAQDLGYFDQAHLINDFRSIVGYSPTQYGKRAAGKI
jgi:AraC-like DNA-binding protein